MARISGVDLPREKAILYALPLIYGIGRTNGALIIEKAGIDPRTKVRDLTDAQITQLRELVEEYPVEGDLRREVHSHIRRLLDIRCYRGIRHGRGLPTRGQRTRSNARTRKGKAKTVAGKKKAKK